MPAGYGSDNTSGSADVAGAIAQIFQTGVTAYVDSQAIQNGYQINNPQYFQAGYPAGQSVVYTPVSQGTAVMPGSLSGGTLLLIGIGVLALVWMAK